MLHSLGFHAKKDVLTLTVSSFKLKALMKVIVVIHDLHLYLDNNVINLYRMHF